MSIVVLHYKPINHKTREEERHNTGGALFANKISSSSFNGFFHIIFFLGLLLSVAPYSRSLCAIDNITFMIIVVAYYCYCLRCAQLAHSGHHE